MCRLLGVNCNAPADLTYSFRGLRGAVGGMLFL
jgi:predicted glutamine amidotransferase